VKTAAALMENGASQVYACVRTRAVGADRTEYFEVLHHRSIVTNTIPLSEAARRAEIKVLPSLV
jgi:phosphoribosylpyrophosphate synthetase